MIIVSTHDNHNRDDDDDDDDDNDRYNPELATRTGPRGLPSPYELVLLAYDDFFGNDGFVHDDDDDNSGGSDDRARNALNVGIARTRFIKQHIDREAKRYDDIMASMIKIDVSCRARRCYRRLDGKNGAGMVLEWMPCWGAVHLWCLSLIHI